MIIATFQDDEVKVHVARIDRGFSVAVQDVDSELFFDQVMIYPTEEAALTAAKKAVRSEGDALDALLQQNRELQAENLKLIDQLQADTEATLANIRAIKAASTERWIVEQFVVEDGNRCVLPELHTEAAAQERAQALTASSLNYGYAARLATADEVAQITSLIAASDAWQARCRAEISQL